MKDFKRKVLTDNISAREQEIAVYDINITNYKHVAELACNEIGMEDFVIDLRQRLDAERIERRKAELILIALTAQLAALA